MSVPSHCCNAYGTNTSARGNLQQGCYKQSQVCSFSNHQMQRTYRAFACSLHHSTARGVLDEPGRALDDMRRFGGATGAPLTCQKIESK